MERWDFGRIAYGEVVKTKPSFANSWECPEGCTFTDDLGVEYQTWEGDEIVIKRFVVTANNRGRIPFGIDHALDSQSVLKTVERKTGKTLKCVRHEDNGNIPPGILFCSAEVTGGDPGVFLNVIFGMDGRLKEIELFTHYI